MKRYMVDIESLGRQPGGVILSVGWVRFSIEGADRSTAKEVRISVKSSLECGFSLDAETIEWWLTQPGKPWRDGANSLSVGDALMQLSLDLRNAGEVWAKPATYDLVALRDAYARIGGTCPWPYRSERCMKTLLSLHPVPPPLLDGLVAHSAMDDAIEQAEHAASALRSRL